MEYLYSHLFMYVTEKYTTQSSLCRITEAKWQLHRVGFFFQKRQLKMVYHAQYELLKHVHVLIEQINKGNCTSHCACL